MEIPGLAVSKSVRVRVLALQWINKETENVEVRTLVEKLDLRP